MKVARLEKAGIHRKPPTAHVFLQVQEGIMYSHKPIISWQQFSCMISYNKFIIYKKEFIMILELIIAAQKSILRWIFWR